MSVYSGFASRIQETTYNHAVYNMLCLLQLKVAKSLKGGTLPLACVEPFDDSMLLKYFAKFYKKLSFLEESKHMAPLFSHSLADLATHFNMQNTVFDNDKLLRVTTTSELTSYPLIGGNQ